MCEFFEQLERHFKWPLFVWVGPRSKIKNKVITGPGTILNNMFGTYTQTHEIRQRANQGVAVCPADRVVYMLYTTTCCPFYFKFLHFFHTSRTKNHINNIKPINKIQTGLNKILPIIHTCMHAIH